VKRTRAAFSRDGGSPRVTGSTHTSPVNVSAGPLPVGGLRIAAYSAEPGTPSDDALKLLASWAATLDQAGHSPGRTA